MGKLIPPDENTLAARVTEHLGVDPVGLASYSERFDPSEQQNVQLAFNAMSAAKPWDVIGLPGDVRNYGGFSLVGLLTGRFGITDAAPEYVNLSVSADATLPCILAGLHLAWHDDQPLVVLLLSAVDHGPRQGLSIEVLARDDGHVQAFIAELREQRARPSRHGDRHRSGR